MVSKGDQVRFEMEWGLNPGEKTAVVTGEVVSVDGDTVDVDIEDFDSDYDMSGPDSVENGVAKNIRASHVEQV